jgi:hypothetical protein
MRPHVSVQVQTTVATIQGDSPRGGGESRTQAIGADRGDRLCGRRSAGQQSQARDHTGGAHNA